jgi:hypothetical protein
MRLLEKIEELTLYLLQQQAQLTALKRQIAALRERDDTTSGNPAV